jgi:hypothetical protein
MNSAQITSLVKQLLTFAGSALATHGAVKAAAIVNAEDTSGLIIVLAVWIYSHFFQHTDEQEATPTPLPPSKGGGVLPPVVGALIICAGLSALLVGCGGSARLQLGGAYAPATFQTVTNDAGNVSTNTFISQQPDFVLYAADATFDFAYSSMEAAFKIERDNRLFLWKISPDIKHSLDSIRPQASLAVKAYTSARADYIAHPTPANAAAMQSFLSEVSRLASAASAATASIKL